MSQNVIHTGNSRSLLRPAPDVAVLGLRAMRMVGAADGTLHLAARQMLLAAQRLILGVDVAIDELAPIEPEELARSFPQPLRVQFVRAMVVMTLVSGKPSPASTAVVRRFARGLEVDEPALHTIELFAQRHMVLGMLDYHRHSNTKQMLTDEIAEHGLCEGAIRLFGARGLTEDKLVAEPFLALGDLPEGTLGRMLFDHYRSNHFPLPGERGGFPESGVYHDLTHVLSGYGTDPLGELQAGAFTAGFRRDHGFHVALLPILLFASGINVAPIPQEPDYGIFERPGTAERYILAYERGTKVNVDLSDHWEFWPQMRSKIEDVRRELGIT